MFLFYNNGGFGKCTQPSISNVRWNEQLIVNRIARWAKNISHGKEDTRQTMIYAKFMEAGTVGPVAK